jgi:hypothetical protein
MGCPALACASVFELAYATLAGSPQHSDRVAALPCPHQHPPITRYHAHSQRHRCASTNAKQPINVLVLGMYFPPAARTTCNAHRTAYHNATPQPPVPPVRRTASKRCCCQCVLGLSLPAAPACVALCFFDAGGRSTLGYEQGASAVPAQMWQGRAQSRRRYGRGEPFALPGRAMASRRQSTRSSP